MSNGGEYIQVEFHNEARPVFFSHFHAFEREASAVNRKTNEFDFQKLKKKYVASFEQQLKSIAGTVLKRHKNENQTTEINPMLHQLARDYLHNFVQKINAL